MKIHIGRLELAALIGLVITLGVSSVTGFMRDCAELRQEVLRIHILADSDQEADQAVKLQVRDAVLEAINQDFSGDGTLEGTIACLEDEMDRIEETANEVLAEAGMPYQAKAELTEMYFTTREYERDGSTFSMPAGRYQALRITLGSGEGHNWWCVAYPPCALMPLWKDRPQWWNRRFWNWSRLRSTSPSWLWWSGWNRCGKHGNSDTDFAGNA